MQLVKDLYQSQWRDDDLQANIRRSLASGLPEFVPTFIKHDGLFVIVGSGPSLPQFIEEIRQEKASGRPIISMNGAHDFLIENGIIPDVFMTVDPRPMPQNLKHINDETYYLIASRVGDDTFDRLKGRKVILWHAYSESDEIELLNGKFVVTGGTTTGLRAFCFGYCMGFRRFRAYGMDSCFHGEQKHYKADKNGPMPKMMDIHVGGKSFYTNYAMASQAKEFQNLYNQLPGITIEIMGDGLLAAILEERKRLGMPC